MRVAIQGERGSFHHAAAVKQYGGDIDLIECESFAQVFTALEGEVADAAIVAIENSLYGSINEVYDLLLHHAHFIVAEIPWQIHQCLIGYPNTPLDQISHVYSHPVALAQCSTYLANTLDQAEKVEYTDTAGAVRLISERQDYTGAAIASAFAAELFGMAVLAADIQNHALNFTRFLAIEKQAPGSSNANKASLVLQTNHRPGALYQALGAFADRGLNLTKLQSRPIPGKVWRYMFYVDVMVDQNQLDEITSELEAQGCNVRILGSYRDQTAVSP